MLNQDRLAYKRGEHRHLIHPFVVFRRFHNLATSVRVMSAKIVQINFRFGMSITDYEKRCNQVADNLAKVPGLQWKAWLLNERRREAGGIYLFNDESAADTYVNGPIISAMKNAPGIEQVEIKSFNILPNPSAVTRFPSP
jgi:hypothetical protein